MEIQLVNKYKPLYKAIPDTRYFLITGGRGSGKSFHVSLALLNLTYEEGHVILFTRWTLTTAYISIIPEFIDKIELLGLQSDFDITKTEITNLKTGSKILFRGIKTSQGTATANLKSIAGVTTFVLDEAEELYDEDVFDKIDLSVRSTNKPNRIIIVLNPTNTEHWIYNRFIAGKINEGENTQTDDTTFIHTTYKDNIQNLNPSFLDSISKMSAEKYNHVILGKWANKKDGTVYENWQIGDFEESLPSCYALDYGFYPDPLAICKVAVDKKKKHIYLKEITYKTNLSISQIANELNSIPKNSLIVCDVNEQRTTTELQRMGWHLKNAEKGKVIDGIRKIQDYTLIVEKNSSNFVKELNNYIWSDRRADLPIDSYNHLLDGMRYAVNELTKGNNATNPRNFKPAPKRLFVR